MLEQTKRIPFEAILAAMDYETGLEQTKADGRPCRSWQDELTSMLAGLAPGQWLTAETAARELGLEMDYCVQLLNAHPLAERQKTGESAGWRFTGEVPEPTLLGVLAAALVDLDSLGAEARADYYERQGLGRRQGRLVIRRF